MDELKVPYISKELVEYLETQFGMDYMVGFKAANNDEHIGFIKGVREIIANLRNTHEEQMEKEV